MREVKSVVGFDIPWIMALVESESMTFGIPTLSILTRAAQRATDGGNRQFRESEKRTMDTD